jgi:ribosomal protein L5
MHITLVTSPGTSDENSRALLREFGMPFSDKNNKN